MFIRRVLLATFVAAASVGAIASASAQGLTRDQVRQQLIDAEANGSRIVTDPSYPDVSPVFAHQVAHSAPQRAESAMAGGGHDSSGFGSDFQPSGASGSHGAGPHK